MLRSILVVLLLLLMGTFAIAKDALPTPHNTLQQLDTIVATVNDKIITQSEFDQALSFTKKQFAQRNLPVPDEKTLRKKVLQNLIDRQLQLQLAKQHDVKASKKEVEQRIQQIASQNQITLAELKKQVAKEGFSYDAFKKRIRDQVIMGKVQRQMISGGINVTDEDISEFRKQQAGDVKTMLFHIGDILIPVDNIKNAAEKSKAHTQALDLMQAIQKGSSVPAAVKKYHAQYTDLGQRRLNDLPSLFSKPAVSTKVGGIGGPILAPNGYHVLHLIEKKSGVSQVSDQKIRQLLMQKKYEASINDALKKIRNEAYIKINPDYQ